MKRILLSTLAATLAYSHPYKLDGYGSAYNPFSWDDLKIRQINDKTTDYSLYQYLADDGLPSGGGYDSNACWLIPIEKMTAEFARLCPTYKSTMLTLERLAKSDLDEINEKKRQEGAEAVHVDYYKVSSFGVPGGVAQVPLYENKGDAITLTFKPISVFSAAINTQLGKTYLPNPDSFKLKEYLGQDIKETYDNNGIKDSGWVKSNYNEGIFIYQASADHLATKQPVELVAAYIRKEPTKKNCDPKDYDLGCARFDELDSYEKSDDLLQNVGFYPMEHLKDKDLPILHIATSKYFAYDGNNSDYDAWLAYNLKQGKCQEDTLYKIRVNKQIWLTGDEKSDQIYKLPKGDGPFPHIYYFNPNTAGKNNICFSGDYNPSYKPSGNNGKNWCGDGYIQKTVDHALPSLAKLHDLRLLVDSPNDGEYYVYVKGNPSYGRCRKYTVEAKFATLFDKTVDKADTKGDELLKRWKNDPQYANWSDKALFDELRSKYKGTVDSRWVVDKINKNHDYNEAEGILLRNSGDDILLKVTIPDLKSHEYVIIDTEASDSVQVYFPGKYNFAQSDTSMNTIAKSVFGAGVNTNNIFSLVNASNDSFYVKFNNVHLKPGQDPKDNKTINFKIRLLDRPAGTYIAGPVVKTKPLLIRPASLSANGNDYWMSDIDSVLYADNAATKLVLPNEPSMSGDYHLSYTALRAEIKGDEYYFYEHSNIFGNANTINASFKPNFMMKTNDLDFVAKDVSTIDYLRKNGIEPSTVCRMNDEFDIFSANAYDKDGKINCSSSAQIKIHTNELESKQQNVLSLDEKGRINVLAASAAPEFRLGLNLQKTTYTNPKTGIRAGEHIPVIREADSTIEYDYTLTIDENARKNGANLERIFNAYTSELVPLEGATISENGTKLTGTYTILPSARNNQLSAALDMLCAEVACEKVSNQHPSGTFSPSKIKISEEKALKFSRKCKNYDFIHKTCQSEEEVGANYPLFAANYENEPLFKLRYHEHSNFNKFALNIDVKRKVGKQIFDLLDDAGRPLTPISVNVIKPHISINDVKTKNQSSITVDKSSASIIYRDSDGSWKTMQRLAEIHDASNKIMTDLEPTFNGEVLEGLKYQSSLKNSIKGDTEHIYIDNNLKDSFVKDFITCYDGNFVCNGFTAEFNNQ